MSSIRNLRSFVAVARLGSFSAAADYIGLTQAAVSLQMRNLEEEFGRSLFERRGRVATLSAAGQDLLPGILKLLDEYENLRLPKAPPGTYAGQITAGGVVSSMNILAAVVSELKTAHPRLSIKLISGKSSELARMVERRDIDAALIVSDGKPGADIASRLLYQEPLRVIASASAPDLSAVELLATQPFLRFDRGQHTGRQIDRALQQLGIVPDEFLELNAIEQLLALVRQGLGVTLLPLLHNLDATSLDDLRVLPLPGELAHQTRDIVMVQRRDTLQGSILDALYARCVSRASRVE